MNKPLINLRFFKPFAVAVCLAMVAADLTTAQEPTEFGVWKTVEEDGGKRVQVMRMKVYPQPEPIPAFKHRLVPAPNDRADGNAATFYLKALGFFEQTNARIALHELEKKWRDEATDQQGNNADYPPHSWHDMSPESLPMDQVEKYLNLISFQEEFLYDAARRKHYTMDRAMEREKDPIGYLLPEVQQMRELARQQTVRCRFALAEGRNEDAVEIVGQMMALGSHVASDQFFVSGLVGLAIEGIAIDEGLMLSQQADTPNLYWAIAACPDPMIDLTPSVSWEREFLYQQVPILREVGEEVRPAGYWIDFMNRITPQWNGLAKNMNSWSDQKLTENLDSFQAATFIATQYPSARRFLSEFAGMTEQQLDEYPVTQVVMLALVKFHDMARDESAKRFYLPYVNQLLLEDSEEKIREWQNKFGAFAEIAGMLLAATEQINAAVARGKQRLAHWQTLEAIRMTAAENNGALPKSLDDLVVPAPLDPVTNRPFEYSLEGQVATLSGGRVAGTGYRMLIEIAQPQSEQE